MTYSTDTYPGYDPTDNDTQEDEEEDEQ